MNPNGADGSAQWLLQSNDRRLKIKWQYLFNLQGLKLEG